MKPASEHLDVSTEELEALLEGVREALGETGYQKLKAAIHTLGYITELLETHEATIEKLHRLLCQSSTEKTEEVLKRAGVAVDEKNHNPAGQRAGKTAAPGHGRNGAAAYGRAQKIKIPHASLKAGGPCPDAQCSGKVYALRDPGVLVRIKGQSPIDATVYELEKLRCNLCGKVFTAEAPEGVGEQKYDATAASMIALLRYGSGFPWNRLEGLQDSLGVPLPAATQCEIVAETAAALQPAYEELIRQAAQGEVLHNDDTSMRVLSLNRAQARAADTASERTGVFTSGIISTAPGRDIALFFTGRQHAGENLADVLKQRATELRAPIQMCDALSRNLPKLPKELEIIVGHCLAHSRRRFVEVTPNFPEECRFVLESFREVYVIGIGAAVTHRPLPHPRKLHAAGVGCGRDELYLVSEFLELCHEPLPPSLQCGRSGSRSMFNVSDTLVKDLPDQPTEAVGDSPDRFGVPHARS